MDNILNLYVIKNFNAYIEMNINLWYSLTIIEVSFNLSNKDISRKYKIEGKI